MSKEDCKNIISDWNNLQQSIFAMVQTMTSLSNLTDYKDECICETLKSFKKLLILLKKRYSNLTDRTLEQINQCLIQEKGE